MGMVHQRGLGRPVSLRSSAFPRFEWDLPLDGTLRRKLDVSVKSNSSFMSRERELLGKVSGHGLKLWGHLGCDHILTQGFTRAVTVSHRDSPEA